MQTRQKMTFIILPVGLNCNIACRYCYHGAVSRKTRKQDRMSDEVLKRIMIDAPQFQSDIDFLWHGGEPLLAGKDHFKKAIDFQRQTFLTGAIFNGRVRNVIQSNLTLLSENLCSFFAKNNFILSTSIDGGRDVHDANRVFANGSGTHDRVLKSIRLWRKRGRNIGAVSLVTKSNVHQAIESLKMLKESGITSCNFHFCAQDESGSINAIPTKEETLLFFKNVFDLWLEDDNPDFPIRNFRNVLRTLCGGKPLDCTSNINGCYGFMAITANGDVYPCHRYVERNNFRIGNVLESSLLEIYDRSQSVYRNMCSLSENCQNCEWLNACGNGCAFERLTTNGSFKSTDPECSIKKGLFKHIKDKVEHLFM